MFEILLHLYLNQIFNFFYNQIEKNLLDFYDI